MSNRGIIVSYTVAGEGEPRPGTLGGAGLGFSGRGVPAGAPRLGVQPGAEAGAA